MTLAEFEHWLAVEVSERYHRDRHRGIGATPLSVWEHAMSRGAPSATCGSQTLPTFILTSGIPQIATLGACSFSTSTTGPMCCRH
jgi:putative transposase